MINGLYALINGKIGGLLSRLKIDVNKDWGTKRIQTLGPPDTANDAARDDTIDSKITTHKGDASAHHAKTTNASELTSGALNSAGRLPALTSGKIWAGNASNRPAEEDKPGWIASGNYSAGDTITDQCSPVDFEVEAGVDYTKVVEFCLPRGGTIRVKFDIRATTQKTYGSIYRNGSAVGTEQSTESDTFVTFSEDIAGWSAGDLLQLYIKNPLGGGVSAKATNLRLYTG